MPKIGAGLKVGTFVVGSGGGPVTTPGETFTLKEVYAGASGSFFYGTPRTLYETKDHISGGKIVTADPEIQEGLRELGIFDES